MTSPIAVRSVSVSLKANFTSYLSATDKAAAATLALRQEMDLLAHSAGSLDLPAKKAAAAFDAEARAAKKATVTAGQTSTGLEKAKKSTDGLTDGIGKSTKATGGLLSELDKLAATSEGRFNHLVLGIGGLGVALGAAFGAAVKASADFDQQMSHVGAVLNTTGLSSKQTADQLDQLRQAAIKAGKDTSFSASEAAAAEEELAKAGVSTSDILGGALSGTLSLASAGTLELADAATYAARAMNIFGLSGDAVGHVADVLAAGANKSAADVKQLADAMAQGGLVAHSVGLSLEDTVGVLSAFADNALVGSDAGTSLKAMFQALQSPSEKSASIMQQLGINLYDAKGQFIGIVPFVQQLRTSLSGLTQAQRDAAMSQIFGADATRAATILYNEGADGIEDYITAVNDQGAASETAAKKMNNLSGDVEKLKGSLETLAITSGSGANSGLRALVQTADKALDVFSDLPGWLQSTLVYMTGIGGAGLLAGAGFLKARQSAKEFLTTLTEMGDGGAKASKFLSSIGKYAGYAGAAVLGITALYSGLKALMDWSDTTKPQVRNLEELSNTLLQFATSGKLTGQALSVLGPSVESWAEHFERVTLAQKDWAAGSKGLDEDMNELNKVLIEHLYNIEDLDTEYRQSQEDIGKLNGALADLVSNGHASQAALLFDNISGALIKQGYTQQQVNDLFGVYREKAEQAAAANSGVAKGFATAAGKAKVLAGSLEDAIKKGQTLTDVWNELNGALLATDQAMLDANEALAAVKKSFDDNGKAISGNSDAALKNRIVVGEAAKAAAKAAQTKYEETGSVEAANKVYDEYINQLRKVLHNAGLTDKQIDTLLNDYAAMPATVTTQINAAGLDAAHERVLSYTRSLNALSGRIVTTTVIVDTVTGKERETVHRGYEAKRWGGVRYAQTGLLSLGPADIYPAGDRPTYAFAERGTGGEAFVPRHGNYDRSMAILREAAAWYGARVAPAGHGWDGAAAGGGVTHNYNTTITPKYVSLGPAEYAAIEQRNAVKARVGRPQ
jgi:TP901 family phage tail tape measure protein